jgi:hypothetical protein
MMMCGFMRFFDLWGRSCWCAWRIEFLYSNSNTESEGVYHGFVRMKNKN